MVKGKEAKNIFFLQCCDFSAETWDFRIFENQIGNQTPLFSSFANNILLVKLCHSLIKVFPYPTHLSLTCLSQRFFQSNCTCLLFEQSKRKFLCILEFDGSQLAFQMQDQNDKIICTNKVYEYICMYIFKTMYNTVPCLI